MYPGRQLTLYFLRDEALSCQTRDASFKTDAPELLFEHRSADSPPLSHSPTTTTDFAPGAHAVKLDNRSGGFHDSPSQICYPPGESSHEAADRRS